MMNHRMSLPRKDLCTVGDNDTLSFAAEAIGRELVLCGDLVKEM